VFLHTDICARPPHQASMREKNISKAVRDTSDSSSDQRSVSSGNINPRVYWSQRPQQPSTSWDLDDIVNVIRGSRSNAVCIIEDLEKHPGWRDIGRRLALHGDFLDAHISREWKIRERQPWRWAVGATLPDREQRLEEDQEWRCIEGFYSLSTSRKTRISYHRYRRHVCKFKCGSVDLNGLMRCRSISSEPSACCHFYPAQLNRQ
jgi:hypothetical protein